MSSRAIPALEVTIAALDPDAIWLDSVCVPSQEPVRTMCLRSMGAIYAAAKDVVAVLSIPSSRLLDEIRRTGRVDRQTLLTLEHDEWVSRAWTYQEIANSQAFEFLSEGHFLSPVSGAHMFSALGHALEQYRKDEQIDVNEFRLGFPLLDSFESLLGDWLGGEANQRSAYAAMSAMATRSSERPEDRFYAMIGSISSEPPADAEELLAGPSEYFMRVCERKGDYSFIFVDGFNQISWRPAPESLRPILPWYSSGVRQTGELHSAFLRLNNMAHGAFGTPSESATRFVREWLVRAARISSPSDLGSAIRETLGRAGLRNAATPIELECGYFVPQRPVELGEVCDVAIARDIFFNFGAPGLLLEQSQSGPRRIRDVGVFVGPAPAIGNSISVI